MSETKKWVLDPAHSEVGFKIKHLMITNVSGSFGKFDVTAETSGDDFGKGLKSILFTSQTSTITTNNEQRDQHLRSADFFDAEQFPEIKFESVSTNANGNDSFVVEGNLTIKDVTKPVKLNVEYGGLMKDPWGNTKAGFTIQTKINRKDWGLNWNAALETGGVLVSDEVKIQGEIQLVTAN